MGENAEKVTKMADFRIFQAVRAFSGMLGRMRLGRGLTSFDGRRNYQEIFGWDKLVDVEQMLYMYNRGGLAKRVIDAFPDATWARPPVLWAEGDPEWDKLWATLLEDKNIWTAFHRLDKLCCLGHYAVMVLGTDKPNLEVKLTSASEITYSQPYGEFSVKIEQWDTNQTSPTFGQPLMYRIYPENTGITGRATAGSSDVTPTRSSFRVHASRVLHVAKGSLEEEIFGQPMLLPIWDYLTDLRKVVGSSSESYWIAANRGLQADVDKEMQLTEADAAALQEEIEDFYNGFRRFIRTKGVDMNALENDTSDPTGPFKVLVTLISGTMGIPQRILLGSEAGQLASAQDKGNWAERVEESRTLYSEPQLVKPFVKWCITHKLIRPPNGQLNIQWPDAYRMSPLERGQTQAQTARSIANVVKMFESENEDARTLLTREEARALLGFSSDNRILSDNPDP